MDIENIETPEIIDNFTTELTKTFAINLAASVGAMAGFVLLYAGYGAVTKIQERRAAKKANKLTLVEEID